MNAIVPSRPVLRWHGGKWKLAPWIIRHFPPHRCYVEPFGGAASVLLRKPRSYAEIYNDLDDEVVGLFRVLRDGEAAARLRETLRLTPFARTEFRAAYEPSDDPIERARRLVVRAYMGFGSNAQASQHKGHRSTGFRANSNRSGTTPAADWANYPDVLEAIIARVCGVVIECRPALDVMRAHDGPETLHYVDPPYMPDTRALGNRYELAWRMYRHELTPEDHAELLQQLRQLAGMVLLSGYPHPLYDEALPDWRRVTCETFADGARPRTEVLWINPAAAGALERGLAGPLFAATGPAWGGQGDVQFGATGVADPGRGAGHDADGEGRAAAGGGGGERLVADAGGVPLDGADDDRGGAGDAELARLAAGAAAGGVMGNGGEGRT